MAVTKVALVTASSAGLGAAIAKAFISEMRVVINYHSASSRAHAVLQELDHIIKDSKIHDTEPRFIAIKSHVTQTRDIQSLVSETIDKMGRLDVVISNVGWTRITDFSNLDDNVHEDDWNRCFDVNVKSHLFLLHASKQYLEESEGSFITVASVAGVKPSGSSLVSILSYPPCRGHIFRVSA